MTSLAIRNEKSWFSGTKATKINDALVFLELFDRQKDKNKAYDDLKKNLNNHSGLSMENRKRFISGFFLALTETLSMKKQESH